MLLGVSLSFLLPPNKKIDDNKFINTHSSVLCYKMKKVRDGNSVSYVSIIPQQILSFKDMLTYQRDSLQNIIDDKMDKINKRLSIFSLEPIDFNQRGELIKSLELISKDSLNKITDIGKKKLYDRQTTSNQRIISNYIKNIDRNVNKINKNTVEVHKKFALPISIIIFLLIGAPLGIQLKRGGIGMSMAISLMFFILYYILIVGGEKLADKNQLDPILAMWLPNIIILIFGYALIFKLKKN